jgi:hypothetical protein
MLSKHLNITMEYVDAHPEKEWDVPNLSRNPNLTMDYIESHPEIDWDWSEISSNTFGEASITNET